MKWDSTKMNLKHAFMKWIDGTWSIDPQKQDSKPNHAFQEDRIKLSSLLQHSSECFQKKVY